MCWILTTYFNALKFFLSTAKCVLELSVFPLEHFL
jgi:hypothetical protein